MGSHPLGKHALGSGVDQMGSLRGIPSNHILVAHVLGRSKEKFGANHKFFCGVNPLNGPRKF
jgi:hypothetical protein